MIFSELWLVEVYSTTGVWGIPLVYILHDENQSTLASRTPATLPWESIGEVR